jgi:long-subunit acyl-CoA synthetase (AMP-forming)
LRQVICGGAAINPEILDGIRDFGIESLQGYGLTECAPICALNPQKAPRSASAGYLIPGFDGYIDEPDPETGIGEICVTGTNVMLGYYNDPEATEAVLVDGWFHTGDYGYIDKDRYIYITGRKKNIIITKTGKNVFPEELEYYLNCSDLIDESMVWEDVANTHEDTLIAATIRVNSVLVEESLGDNPTQKELSKLIWDEINEMNTNIPYFKRIKKIYLRKDEFEQTTSKKIRRTIDSNKQGQEV